MILVLGASGLVGSQIVKHLAGQAVRTTTGKREQATRDRVFVDVLTGEGLTEAFKGIDRAFLLSPGGYANHYEIVSRLIAEAKKAGVRRVVLMTAMGANADTSGGFGRAEIELQNSGLEWNIIRPNWFMDNFTTFWVHGIRAAGLIELPVGDAKTTFIDSRDIAAVAAKLLTSDALKNRDFDLTGPEALTHAEIAAKISKAIDRPVRFNDGDPAALKKVLLGAGLNEPYTDFLLLILSYLKAGYSQKSTTSVKDITGREPRTFDAYASEHASDFKAESL